MSLIDTLRADVEDAMRAGERERVGALRLILSELQKAAKEGDDDELAVLRRERKRRNEAAAAYRDGGRPELAEAEEAEAGLITAYLPPELGEQELDEIVTRAVEEAGASSPKDVGRVTGRVMAEVEGRADGRRVQAKVREALGA